MSDFNVIHVNNEAWHVFTSDPISTKKGKYTVMKADSGFSLFLRTLLISATSNGQVLCTLSLISSVTMGLMTTPHYTGVNAHLCHSQSTTPTSSPSTRHCNVIQRPTGASFVPVLDMHLSFLMKPAALAHLSLKKTPHYNMYNNTLIRHTFVCIFLFFPPLIFLSLYLCLRLTSMWQMKLIAWWPLVSLVYGLFNCVVMFVVMSSF